MFCTMKSALARWMRTAAMLLLARLSRIYGDLGCATDELRSIGIAIDEARNRLDAAKEAQRLAAGRDRARKLEVILADIEQDARGSMS